MSPHRSLSRALLTLLLLALVSLQLMPSAFAASAPLAQGMSRGPSVQVLAPPSAGPPRTCTANDGSGVLLIRPLTVVNGAIRGHAD